MKEASNPRERKFTLLSWLEHISLQDKINFARHLAIIIKAGLPALEGLKIIRKQTSSKTLLRIIDQLILDVNNGQFIALSLERYHHVFGEFFISIIRVGESSGTLAENLFYLADELKKSKMLRSRVRSAMIYPIILLIATIGISSFLTFFIFPKIIPVFSSLNVELPVTTRTLIAVLTFVQTHGLFLLGGLIILAIGLRLLMQVKQVKYTVHRTLLFVPVTSSLMISVNMANFTRVLAILLKSGTKIVEAVLIVANTVDNLVYRRHLQLAAEAVKRGGSFSKYLVEQNKIFPPILSAMIEVGENTGNLEDNLLYLSEYYSDEVEVSLKNLTALMEPLIILVMGLIVTFVALSIITPIYSITQGLQK